MRLVLFLAHQILPAQAPVHEAASVIHLPQIYRVSLPPHLSRVTLRLAFLRTTRNPNAA